jgi:hypothetical protein
VYQPTEVEEGVENVEEAMEVSEEEVAKARRMARQQKKEEDATAVHLVDILLVPELMLTRCWDVPTLTPSCSAPVQHVPCKPAQLVKSGVP